jgi:hypothetical protein
MVRGDRDPYPDRFRLGILELRSRGSTWKPRRSSGQAEIQIPASITEIHPRARDPKTDRGIKSGGAFDREKLLGNSGFTVLVLSTPDGPFEMAVPNVDVELVVSVLSPR